MSSRSGFGCRLRQNCRFFPGRQNCRFLAKTLAISLQPSIHIKLNDASQVQILSLRSHEQCIKRRRGGGSWNCFVLSLILRVATGHPGQESCLLQRNTDQSVVCLTRDQRIAARKAQLSEVRSNSDSNGRILLPHNGGGRGGAFVELWDRL